MATNLVDSTLPVTTVVQIVVPLIGVIVAIAVYTVKQTISKFEDSIEAIQDDVDEFKRDISSDIDKLRDEFSRSTKAIELSSERCKDDRIHDYTRIIQTIGKLAARISYMEGNNAK